MTTETSTPTQGHPLPTDWGWMRLGEVCSIDRHPAASDSATIIGLEHIESDSGHVDVPPTDDQSLAHGLTYAFDQRHVLYGKLRPYLNKVALPTFAGRCTTEIIPLLPNEDCDREFLAWLLRRPETVAAAMQEKTGTRMPRADIRHLFKMHVPFPPLPEQARIVAILREEMDGVQRARAAALARLEAARALPAAFLRSVFDSDEAQHWPRIALGSISAIMQYGLSLKAHDEPTGYPILGMNAIRDGSLSVDRPRYVQVDHKTLEKFCLLPGDLLVNRTNSAELVGKAALFEEPGTWLFASYLIRIRLIHLLAQPQYVHAVLQSYLWHRYLYPTIRRAVGQANINAQEIGRFEFPLPSGERQSDVARQLAVARREADKLVAIAERQLATIDALPPALLRRAFAGEL